ncbi:MAG: aldo/keto reductase [Elusimicrobiales bacterium]|nr:aldo/keto reductase [Elusimicrobiales bacterium]
MEKRELGKTGRKVSVLGYGSGVLSGASPDDARVERLLNRLLDAGVNYIDTSPDYGRSEETIGRILSRRRREYVLATKCGCPDRGWGRGHIWTRERLLLNIENSLRRLRTDVIDVWQLHNPAPEMVRRGGLLDVMERARRQGKVRFVSISTSLPAAAAYIGWGTFDVFQLPYGALDRRGEAAVAAASAAGAGVVIRSSIAEGEPASGLSRDRLWKFWTAARLDSLRTAGESRTSFLLRFALSHPGLDTAVIGTRSEEHLKENLRAAVAGPLPPEVLAEACRRLDSVGRTAKPPRRRVPAGAGGPGRAEVEIRPSETSRLPVLVEEAARNGARVRLRAAAGNWNREELAALRSGLAGLGKLIISGVARGRKLQLDGEGGRLRPGSGRAAAELRRGLDSIFSGLESLTKSGRTRRRGPGAGQKGKGAE